MFAKQVSFSKTFIRPVTGLLLLILLDVGKLTELSSAMVSCTTASKFSISNDGRCTSPVILAVPSTSILLSNVMRASRSLE